MGKKPSRIGKTLRMLGELALLFGIMLSVYLVACPLIIGFDLPLPAAVLAALISATGLYGGIREATRVYRSEREKQKQLRNQGR